MPFLRSYNLIKPFSVLTFTRAFQQTPAQLLPWAQETYLMYTILSARSGSAQLISYKACPLQNALEYVLRGNLHGSTKCQIYCTRSFVMNSSSTASDIASVPCYINRWSCGVSSCESHAALDSSTHRLTSPEFKQPNFPSRTEFPTDSDIQVKL